MNMPFEQRDDVDQEHKIEFPELNATLYFLKESENNGLKEAEGLLLKDYEQRVCAWFFLIFRYLGLDFEEKCGIIKDEENLIL